MSEQEQVPVVEKTTGLDVWLASHLNQQDLERQTAKKLEYLWKFYVKS